MSGTGKSTAKSAGPATGGDAMEGLMATNGRALEAAMKTNGAMFEGLVTLGQEMADFGSTRVRCDMETTERLAKCKDFEEAFRVQCAFAREATQQYMEEAGKLLNLSARVARDAWAPPEAPAPRRTRSDESR
ncbi:MAG: phasin family protein [Kiloniellaceae bacterium]